MSRKKKPIFDSESVERVIENIERIEPELDNIKRSLIPDNNYEAVDRLKKSIDVPAHIGCIYFSESAMGYLNGEDIYRYSDSLKYFDAKILDNEEEVLAKWILWSDGYVIDPFMYKDSKKLRKSVFDTSEYISSIVVENRDVDGSCCFHIK